MNRTAIALAGLGLLLMLGTSTTAWTMDISFSSEGRTELLTIGSEDGVSDRFDAGVDVPLPPPPPSSSFSAYRVGDGLFDMLQTDLRATSIWNIEVTSQGSIDIVWDAAPLPLTITIGEDQFSLTESGHHALAAGEHRLSLLEARSSSSLASGGLEDASPSAVSTVSGAHPSALPTATSASTTTSAPTPEGVASSPTTPGTDTIVGSTSESASDTSKTSQPEGAARTPGFGALLAALGLCMLMLTRRDGLLK